MKQTITVELKLKSGQKPYEFHEKKPNNVSYNALQHFFEDIGFNVTNQTSKTKADPGRRSPRTRNVEMHCG